MAQEGMSSGFTKKQKIMAAVIVVVVLFLIYEIYDILKGSSTTVVPEPPKTTQLNQAAMPQRTPNGTPPAPGAPNMATNPLPPPQQVQPLKGLVAANTDELKKQKEQQDQYLSTVNELQMLKLQKDIAETTQAISAAKLATATAEKSINDLFVRPAPAAVSASDYANKLGPGGSMPPGVNAQNAQAPAIIMANYIVISVAMQLNRWSAVLGYQGKLYHVAVGDVLPADGSQVTSISRDAVILKKDNLLRKITLVPAI